MRSLGYAFRTIRQSPALSAVVVCILAFGIGANSAIFSCINATLLNPIPGVTDTSDLVRVKPDGGGDEDVSYADYVDLRDGTVSVAGLAAFSFRPMQLTGGAEPQRIWGSLISTNYCEVVGIRPAPGRCLWPSEERTPVALISHALWKTYFNADPSIVGRTVSINLHAFVVVGVAPQGFQGSEAGLRSDVWIPVGTASLVIPGKDRLPQRASAWLGLIGRLKPSLSAERAQSEITAQMQRIAKQYPESHPRAQGMAVQPLWRASGVDVYLSRLLPMLMGLSAVVLLLTWVNVAALLLVQSIRRRYDVAVRVALGANRWSLVRMFVAESVILALAAGLLASLTTTWSGRICLSLIPARNLPISLDAGLDRTVFAVTMAIALFTGLLFGILPALSAARVSPVDVLKDSTVAAGGAHKRRLMQVLVVAEVSLTVVLLACATLFVRSFRNAQRYDPGFNSTGIVLASFDLFAAGYSKAQGMAFERDLLTRLQALPGVRSVTLTSWIPLGFRERLVPIQPAGYVPGANEAMEVGSALVGPDYLKTLDIPLRAGREFGVMDGPASQKVAVVNQALADRYYGTEDVLGKSIVVDDEPRTIVGVARNSNYFRLGEKRRAFVYVPLFQEYSPTAIVQARASGDMGGVALEIQQAVRQLNGSLPLFDQDTLASRIGAASAAQRLAAGFVGGVGILALLLATVGLYTVIAYWVRARNRELAIRMAVGARPVDVFRVVIGQGLRLTLVGLGCGLVMALIVTRYLGRSVLFGVTSSDPVSFASALAIPLTAALVACWTPASRAARIDPIQTLRHE